MREPFEIGKLDGRALLDRKIFERAFDAAEKLLLSDGSSVEVDDEKKKEE